MLFFLFMLLIGMPLFGVLSALFIWFAPATQNDARLATLSYLSDFGTGREDGHEFLSQNQNIFDISYQSRPFYNAKGLRFGVTGMANAHGTVLAGGMVSKTTEIKKIGITFAEAVNYSHISNYDSQNMSFFINFKTTLDITYPITKNVHAGVGIMHISNIGVKFPNSGINGVRGTLYFFM
jgi:hypothetical protein